MPQLQGRGASWLGRNTLPLAAAPPQTLPSDRQPHTPGTGPVHAWHGGRDPTAAGAAAGAAAAAMTSAAAVAAAVTAAVAAAAAAVTAGAAAAAAAGQPGSGGIPHPCLHPAT